MIITENIISRDEIKETGGGKIGRARATWPFATLTASRNCLKLSISLIGTVMFRPADVVSIESYLGMKGRGLKINHNVKNYNPTIIFLSLSNIGDLIEEIRGTGFLDNKDPLPVEIENEINTYQASGSFPVKTSSAIFFVLVWNAFFLSGELPFFIGHTKEIQFTGARYGLGFAVAFCLGVLFVPAIRQLVLKAGRQLSEVRAFFYFLLAISTIILLSFMAPT